MTCARRTSGGYGGQPRRGRWRTLRAGCAAAASFAVALAGCSDDGAEDAAGDGGHGASAPAREAPQHPPPRLIGDGSTAYTGAQPHQPQPTRLEPGEPPPQFVVFSWDGAGEDGSGLFSRFREAARTYDATMTFFLSGLYVLPEDQRELYRPPEREPGASDISYLSDDHVADTLRELSSAWLEGHEIGTHFNGHFCGPDGVASWTPEQWTSELEQAKWMVEHWKTTTGFEDLPPLPFDYEQELAGGRAPCLEGQDNLLQAAADAGFRYDASGSGPQVWPDKRNGIWDIPLQLVPMPGESFETLSMDYNFMVNQSGPESGDPALYPYWEDQMREGLLAAFDRTYHGNRAPLIIGNHFNQWNGGIYMDAVEDVIAELCPREDVQCVSFKQLVDWLDAQDPEVLDKLRSLGVGEAPQEGWSDFLRG
ncbi:hypothetical protein [Streptomyces sp. 7-21]|jgi:hypothetical protein|uniref:hypothetical protein n=1 Tax=Streptomyces sp. 7-21 TaxID=2802283 RepID=UPI001F378DC7|nr:hypothetical protein [Streptomyces sp. 7-21]